MWSGGVLQLDETEFFICVICLLLIGAQDPVLKPVLKQHLSFFRVSWEALSQLEKTTCSFEINFKNNWHLIILQTIECKSDCDAWVFTGAGVARQVNFLTDNKIFNFWSTEFDSTV